MNIKPRKTPPTSCTNWDQEQVFRVWAESPSFMKDQTPWRCVACFRFLGDCLEYIASLQDHGVDCVFQSPARCEIVRAADQRVVWIPAEKPAEGIAL